jgi:hypothetical protein
MQVITDSWGNAPSNGWKEGGGRGGQEWDSAGTAADIHLILVVRGTEQGLERCMF